LTDGGVFDDSEVRELIEELSKIRAELVELDTRSTSVTQGVCKEQVDSLRNLLQYLGLRRHDIRPLQEKLANQGLSSLGRAESAVLSNLDAVLAVLYRIAGEHWSTSGYHYPVRLAEGRDLLRKKTDALFGPAPSGRAVRIMATMPPEAAEDYTLVRDLVASGMNCMRINCAHDTPSQWEGMITNLRRAEAELGTKCHILMDIPGPKIRTGPLEQGPRVVKIRPKRDPLGDVVSPARVWLHPNVDSMTLLPSPPDASLPVPSEWLSTLRVGDIVRLTDARDASRSLKIVQVVNDCRWAECKKTAYIVTGTRLRLEREGQSPNEAEVGELPTVEIPIVLTKGDTLILTRDQIPGWPASGESPARVSCTLPTAFADIRAGQKIWFDDGRIGGVIRVAGKAEVEVEITQGVQEKLGSDKGINLPDTNLRLPSLTEADLAALPFISKYADMVGYSFVRRAADVHELQARLESMGRGDMGLILKIETKTGFENLPSLLAAGMKQPRIGVMIARGDLAVECGYERLAEVQEEILWICEAAHIPVILATQVLETLTKDGIPSRAEITDAAFGERAECVMLNKGEYLVEAVQALDDILKRMGAHQSKKRSMLRRLKIAEHFP
jgi:pyruvate kinase